MSKTINALELFNAPLDSTNKLEKEIRLALGDAINIESVDFESDEQYMNMAELIKECIRYRDSIEDEYKDAEELAKQALKDIQDEKKKKLLVVKKFEDKAREGLLKFYNNDKGRNELSIVPKVKGISYVNRNGFEVTDLSRVPRKFLKVDDKAVKDYMKESDGTIAPRGIKPIVSTSIRISAKK